MNNILIKFLETKIDKLEAISIQDYQSAADFRDTERQLISEYGLNEESIKRKFFSRYLREYPDNTDVGVYQSMLSDPSSIKDYRNIINKLKRTIKIKKILK